MRKWKLSRKEKWLFLAPALLLAAPVLRGAVNSGETQSPPQRESDVMDKAQRKLAGVQAIDCGVGRAKTLERKPVFEDRAAVDACAVAAFEAKRPFVARYVTETDIETVDSFGITGTPSGQIHFFYYSRSSIWWKDEDDFRQGICPKPKLIVRWLSSDKKAQVVGCGTCAENMSEDTASCILRP
jgi:hypothetical protein